MEGRNLLIDYRFAASDPSRIKEYVTELIRLTPDVIVANSTPVVAARRQATSTIPIVFAVGALLTGGLSRFHRRGFLLSARADATRT